MNTPFKIFTALFIIIMLYMLILGKSEEVEENQSEEIDKQQSEEVDKQQSPDVSIPSHIDIAKSLADTAEKTAQEDEKNAQKAEKNLNDNKKKLTLVKSHLESSKKWVKTLSHKYLESIVSGKIKNIKIGKKHYTQKEIISIKKHQVDKVIPSYEAIIYTIQADILRLEDTAQDAQATASKSRQNADNSKQLFKNLQSA